MRSRWNGVLGIVVSLCASLPTVGASEEIHGAGATFPAPVYTAWAEAYERESGVRVFYDPIGSGAGIDRIREHEIDFGATDAPLSKEVLAGADLLQFPTVIGGVVPVINIRGIEPGRLKLNGAVLAGIYLGRIRKWNAAEIASLNPGVSLPSANITVVHRAEPSGSTLLWSDYLSRSSTEWSTKIGSSLAPSWPTGIGGDGNEGVASLVQRTHFAIGYVEYFYARGHHLSDVALINRRGRFVKAGPESFAAAARHTSIADLVNGAQFATDLDGEASWPITGASFVLIDRRAADRARTRATLQFFEWALRHGEQSARELYFVPLPAGALDPLTERLRQAQQ